jgi:hypothetical protein
VTDGPNAAAREVVARADDARVVVLETPTPRGRWGHPYRKLGIAGRARSVHRPQATTTTTTFPGLPRADGQRPRKGSCRPRDGSDVAQLLGLESRPTRA